MKAKKIRKIPLLLSIMLLFSMITFVNPMPANAVSTTYYVDSVSGNDSNNGTSTGTAWKSIQKVNSITFQAGDKILFKAGCQWTGNLNFKGSGTAASPIVVDKYGTGAKPLFQPGADWVDPVESADTVFLYNINVNNLITLYNVEYWELNNLELYDPKYDSINPDTSNVYRRGIYVEAKDIGMASHIYINNMYIHGFRGFNSGVGKPSGGIILHVETDDVTPANRVITWFDDVKIQNCTIEKVGRTGISVLTPWGTRQPSNGRWTTPPETYIGTRKAFTNLRISNNLIQHVDGDGTIFDTCDGAVFEYNNVNNCLVDSGFAAGVFPWNSNDTVIQFNELYSTHAGGDAQGVEIDALNERSIVQYNYSHDNAGGFVEFCNYDKYISYDGIYRYNISQNDQDYYGVMWLSSKGYNSQVYNNTIYSGPGTRTFLTTGNNVTEAGQIKIYNNIFYNAGTYNTIDFKTSMIDWKNNTYYGFPGIPSNDTAALTTDPKLSNPGSGGYGDGINAVSGYKLLAGSPAINSGLTIANNGGRDYFGNTLYTGAPDRGAHEYNNDPGPTGTTPMAPYGTLIPRTGMSVTATSQDSSEPASNAIDGNTGTTWHTKYTPTIDVLPQSITINLGAVYPVSTVKYSPRQSGSNNGVITCYNMYVSTDNITYTKVISKGLWPMTRTEKSAVITATNARYVKLEAINGYNGFACAAEINVYQNNQTNIVVNPGFEVGSSPWLQWNSAVATTNQRSGSACGQVNKNGSWEQNITVTPNTTYTFTAWLKVGTSGDDFRLGVKNHGGTETYVSATTTTYTQKSITFTTGATTTTARIYAYRPNSGTGAGYADDFQVVKN